MIHTILTISQVSVSALLISAILLQNKGTGLGSAFGSGGVVYQTKRGAEKVLYIATIVFGFLFLALSSALLFF